MKYDEFNAKDLVLSATGDKSFCLAVLDIILPFLSNSSVTRKKRRRGRDGYFDCGGLCRKGRITFVSKKNSEYATVQMKLLAKAEKKAAYLAVPGFIAMRGFEAFRDLDDAELQAFCSLGQVQRYKPGEYIVGCGEKAEYIFIVLSGNVLWSEENRENDQNVQELGPGKMFGEMSLSGGAVVYSADYYCLDFAELLVLAARDVKPFLRNHLALHMSFYNQIAKQMQNQAQATHQLGGLSANLKEVAVVDLCQLINASAKTGKVNFSLQNDITGELTFKNGELVGAIYGEKTGKEAFFSLLGMSDGTYNFVAGGLPAKENDLPPLGNFMSLIIEGSQKLDEQRAATSPAVA